MSSLEARSHSQIPYDKASIKIKSVVKGFHECSFTVDIGDEFFTEKKHGSKGRAIKITNDRGQLGHLQRELVAFLWPFNNGMKW